MQDIIESVELYHYKLPLKKPLRLSAAVLTERESLLLKWLYRGKTYWTEIAPLPGYSPETLEEARQQVMAFFKAELSWNPVNLEQRVQLFSRDLAASVELGLSAFLLELQPNFFGEPKLCGLLTEQELAAGSEFAFTKDASVMKVKVGLRPIDEDIERIRRICSQGGFSGKLRLDANQQWSPDEVATLCAQVDTQRIQWLEDPFANALEYRNWSQISRIPFAYDETLVKTDSVENIDGLAALILKPSLLGMGKTRRLMDWAEQQQIDHVISSGFETPIGLRTLYGLANQKARRQHHGLDTRKYFVEESSSHPLPSCLEFERPLL